MHCIDARLGVGLLNVKLDEKLFAFEYLGLDLPKL